MHISYLNRLSPDVQAFVQEVESAAGVDIEVELDDKLNDGGPLGQGKLKVEIEAQQVRLYAPTNGYFPDGAVLHEALHVRRLLVEGVPRIALADAVEIPPPGFASGLVDVDNALEHLTIVPIELAHHPERRAHWNAVMTRLWKRDLPQVQFGLDRRIGSCLHWTFLRHVLSTSPNVQVAAAFMQGHAGLLAEAEKFADAALALLDDKAGLVRHFFSWFPEVDRQLAALEYLSSTTGTRQEVI